MQRLIDADAVEKVLEEKHFRRVLDSDRWVIADIKKSIMELPTIDAVPVIRCKACRWFRNDDEGTWCVAWAGQNTNPDAFCSYAQPKERGR